MLNYIWAGLIVFAGIFALGHDVSDIRHDTYRNGRPLAATIHFRAPPDPNAKERAADVTIDPILYATHFGAIEKLPASIPATLTRSEGGYQLRVPKEATLPSTLAKMRDFTDAKELQARVEDVKITGADATA